MKSDKGDVSNCVKMLEYFYFKERNLEYIALVFEKLGRSLYDFIKNNKYKGIYDFRTYFVIGYPIQIIQQFAKQILEGIGFLHEKIHLTHTDLKVKLTKFLYKPENLLFKFDKFLSIESRSQWPKVIH